jgi:hypothetical protein
MPWTTKQTGLFLAAAHDPEIAKRHGLSTDKARELAMESPKSTRSSAAKQMAQARALRRKP